MLFTPEETTDLNFTRCVELEATEDDLIEENEGVSVVIDEDSLGVDQAAEPSAVDISIMDNDGVYCLYS